MPYEVLTRAQICETADAIAARQRPDGRLPWHTDQHTDAWNHVEGAMGLVLGGRRAEAELAYTWLIDRQRPDGSWAEQYDWNGNVESPDADTNMCAYVATGAWHHFLVTQDEQYLRHIWPTVERAIDYVLDHQLPGGEIAWNHHADGTIDRRALLSASASTYMSLRCATAIAHHLDAERPDWELSLGLLAHAVRHRPGAFWPKKRWSMDWYYPVLTGIYRDDDGRQRLADGWDTFYFDDRGCRCVSDKPWVTAAETCELVLALDAVDQPDLALRAFVDVQFLRQDDGAYQEGWVFPEDVHWPGRTPPWTAAAVLLADDTLAQRSPAWNLFRGDALPRGLDADELSDHLSEPLPSAESA